MNQIRWLQEQCKAQPASPQELKWMEKEISEIREELRHVATEAALQVKVKFFHDFAKMIEFFALGPISVDHERTLLMIHHEKLRLCWWREPTHAELLSAVEQFDEFNEVNPKQFRNIVEGLGLKLTAVDDLASLKDEHARLSKNGMIPRAVKLQRALKTKSHPFGAKADRKLRLLCERIGLKLIEYSPGA